MFFESNPHTIQRRRMFANVWGAVCRFTSSKLNFAVSDRTGMDSLFQEETYITAAVAAPHGIAETEVGALLEKLGFPVLPDGDEHRRVKRLTLPM